MVDGQAQPGQRDEPARDHDDRDVDGRDRRENGSPARSASASSAATTRCARAAAERRRLHAAGRVRGSAASAASGSTPAVLCRGGAGRQPRRQAPRRGRRRPAVDDLARSLPEYRGRLGVLLATPRPLPARSNPTCPRTPRSTAATASTRWGCTPSPARSAPAPDPSTAGARGSALRAVPRGDGRGPRLARHRGARADAGAPGAGGIGPGAGTVGRVGGRDAARLAAVPGAL